MSPSARESKFAGGTSDLESLKSGKDRNETLNLVCFCTRTKRDGFTPRTEPPSLHQKCKLSRFRDD
jgi:hypothetical protein